MSNRITRGKALVGESIYPGGNKAQKIMVTSAGAVPTVARTDTVAKVLGVLPLGATITDITIYSAAASNAGTTATLSIGVSGGSQTGIINAYDVKGSGAGQRKATTEATLGTSVAASAQVTVTGIYAETGTASTTGGPWLVSIEYV